MVDSPQTPGRATAPLSELSGASNILVRSTPFDGGKREACAHLLGGPAPDNTNALVITYPTSADGWLTQYEQVTERVPDQLTIVSVGETSRSTSDSDRLATHPPSRPGEPAIETLENPADLTGLGINLTEHLRAFDADRWDGGPPNAVICFDSITALLQYTELTTAFRFLHILTGNVQSLDATAHYHLNPDAHDQQTISTIESLFDAQLDVTEGDTPADWTVKRA